MLFIRLFRCIKLLYYLSRGKYYSNIVLKFDRKAKAMENEIKQRDFLKSIDEYIYQKSLQKLNKKLLALRLEQNKNALKSYNYLEKVVLFIDTYPSLYSLFNSEVEHIIDNINCKPNIIRKSKNGFIDLWSD